MRSVVLAILACCASASAFGQGLLRNGGFEQGSFAGWQLSGNDAYAQVFSQDYDGLTQRFGTSYALLGPRGTPATLSESFTDTPGAILHVSFWVASDGAGQDDFFDAQFDGAALAHLAGTAPFGWTDYVASVRATGHDTLSFSVRDDDAYFALDRVAVRQQAAPLSAIPEPAAWTVTFAGLACLAALRRRRR